MRGKTSQATGQTSALQSTVENVGSDCWLPAVGMVMMDAGEPWGRKADIYQAIFKYAFWSSQQESLREKVGGRPWRGLCFTFLQAWPVLVVFVSTSDSFIVHLCAGLQRIEGLSASKLADRTSLCNSLVCVDPAPRISSAVFCVSVGSENGIIISPFISLTQGIDFPLASPTQCVRLATGLCIRVLSHIWLRSGDFSCLLCPISK